MAEEKLPNWLKNRAHLSPDRPAIEFEGHTYSFLELYTLSEKMAGRLSSIGLGAGDSCAVCSVTISMVLLLSMHYFISV